jgi:hypothetical protein
VSTVFVTVVIRTLSRTNRASTWNLECVFSLHLKLPFFPQKCLKVLQFLSHTNVPSDTAPVFRDPIDPTFCIYCHCIEFVCYIYKWKRCMGVCISCSHTTLCVKCTSSPLLWRPVQTSEQNLVFSHFRSHQYFLVLHRAVRFSQHRCLLHTMKGLVRYGSYLFLKLCIFPPFLLAPYFGMPDREKKRVVSIVGYVFSAGEHTVCLPSNQIFILTYVHWYNKFYVFDLGHRWQYKRYTQSTNINTAHITYCGWVLQGTDA